MRSVATPFLKWAGGKGKLAPQIAARAPERFATYHEPFLGGGAVFFRLASGRDLPGARLGDLNAQLVGAYQAVRDDVDGVVGALRPLARRYAALPPERRGEFYYGVRGQRPRDPARRAARLIFLNRTCYNGLYRVNRKGRFNVPHGRYTNPRILDDPGLRAASEALRSTDIHVASFDTSCAEARPGDFVYLDPPYVPLSATAHFTAYTPGSFGPEDQERLREAFEDLTQRGVAALLSNSSHPAVERLYSGAGYTLETVAMSRAINSAGARRNPVPELLIGNMGRPEVVEAFEGVLA